VHEHGFQLLEALSLDDRSPPETPLRDPVLPPSPAIAEFL